MIIVFFGNCRHAVKLDPARSLDDTALRLVVESGTSAIILGGSSGVTRQRLSSLLERVQDMMAHCAPSPPPRLGIELTSPDLYLGKHLPYLLPLVLNSSNVHWLAHAHWQALVDLPDQLIDQVRLTPQGYIILNPDCAAAKLTSACAALNARQAAAYCQLATRIFRLPVVYLEYSGQYGDVELVQTCAAIKGSGHLVYGGGIRTGQQAFDMAQHADTIVVGNLAHEEPAKLKATVTACQQVQPGLA